MKQHPCKGCKWACESPSAITVPWCDKKYNVVIKKCKDFEKK
jgi:hypothetical protein